MILYFSATGNTEYIAKELARQIDDDVLNLLPRIKAGDYSEIHSDRPFVICSPVYVCEMPRFYAAFLEKLELTGSKDVYFVFTSGGYAGISAALGRKLVNKKGMNYRGRAEFTMPRNYPISKKYPLLPEDQNTERIRSAVEHIPEVAEQIRSGERIKLRRLTYFEKIITYPFNPIWVKHKHTSKPFYATEACIGCGKCARLCPLNNISIVDKKPVWTDKCAHCMACLGNCPTEAIEYGKITQGQYRYRFGKYWDSDKK